jgi:hypothetical protein
MQSDPPDPSKKKSALERARRDLESGRPDLARDRITGYLYTLHRRGDYSQEAYLLLGDAYFAMRDFAPAGAAWLLTGRQGPDVDQAVKAFHERFGNDAVNILKIVKPHAPSEDYPAAVQERLKTWGYRYKTYRPRSNPHVEHELGEPQQKGLRPVEVGCLVAILAVAAAYISWLFISTRGR